MKTKSFSFLLIAWLLVPVCLFSQEQKIDADFRKSTVESLVRLINGHYVFPEVAGQTSTHLLTQLKAGHFDQYTDVESFANALTEAVQSVNRDKHMRIRPERMRVAPPDTPERMTEDQLNALVRNRERTAGFVEVKKMEGNIGYLDLRGFAHPEAGVPVADSYMNLLSTSDAIIIDLRKNGGGSPAMVQYLCSYFFDDHRHLNSLYWREGDQTEEFWTLDDVGGKKLPDVPLFIVTSNYTFSGAEEFAYNMQTQKRATLVGETTGGGANPGGGFPVNEKLMVFIPTGRAINPITKTNWEGVGVVPEVKAVAEEALDKAYVLAKVAAEQYRKENTEKYKSYLTSLFKQLDQYEEGSSHEMILQQLKACNEAGLLNQAHINQLGYTYLMQKDRPHTAEAIFKSNTLLFPDSANTYDSYAESLAENGKMEAALDNYRMAVKKAKATNDPQLDLFMENLKKMEEKIKNKP